MAQYNVMSMWSLRWHFTNKSVTGVPNSINLKVTVTVCHAVVKVKSTNPHESSPIRANLNELQVADPVLLKS